MRLAQKKTPASGWERGSCVSGLNFDRQAGTTAPGMGMVSTSTSTSVMRPVTAIIRVRVSRSARAAMAMARRLILVPKSPIRALCVSAKRMCLASAKTLRHAQQKRKPKFVRMMFITISVYFTISKVPFLRASAAKIRLIWKFLFDAPPALHPHFPPMSTRSNAFAMSGRTSRMQAFDAHSAHSGNGITSRVRTAVPVLAATITTTITTTTGSPGGGTDMV